MLKSELILRVAELNPHLYEGDVEAVVNAILNRISDALVVGDRVELRGFGAFTVVDRDGRVGRNPRTGGAIAVPSKRMSQFRMGKVMLGRLNAPKLQRHPEAATAEMFLRVPDETGRAKRSGTRGPATT